MEIHFEETVGIANSISNEAQVVRDLESWLNNCVDVTLIAMFILYFESLSASAIMRHL